MLVGVKFTARQRRFIDEYLVDLNATKAAERAGYRGPHVATTAHHLLLRPHVRAAVDEALAARAARVEVTQDEVLREALRMLRSDFAQAFDENGNLKQVHEIPEDLRRAIASVETDELFEGRGEDRRQIGVTRKLKFWPKDKALELLMRHLGMLNDKVKHELGPSFADLVTASMKPAKPPDGQGGGA